MDLKVVTTGQYFKLMSSINLDLKPQQIFVFCPRDARTKVEFLKANISNFNGNLLILFTSKLYIIIGFLDKRL